MNSNEEIKKEELFTKGIEAFNNKEYFDAHEYWEELWSDYRLKDAKFIQALIQVAVGYFHITNYNFNGANGLLNKCIPKFELYLPKQRGINVINILESVTLSLNNLKEIEIINDFNWNLAPIIKVEDE